MGGLLRSVVAVLLLSSAAWAQEAYPNRPVRIVVGFVAGGGNDIIARLVGQKLSEPLGQPVVVDNRPGAGGRIASEYVAKASRDGHTLLMGANGAMAVDPALYANLPYSPTRDFAPISLVASFPLVLVVNPALPIRSVAELVAYARAHPARANSGGSSVVFQLVTELFKGRTAAPLEYVAYKGANEVLTAVVSGELTASFAPAGPASPLIRGDKLRALATTGRERMSSFPAVPTLAEAGLPGLEVGLWSGLFAPAGTSSAIIARLQDEIARIVALPEIRERMAALSLEPVGSTAEEFTRLMAAEIAQWAAAAKGAAIKLEP
jgi:tripartite-type tricarboxylate transporter receptor subunit TctC